MTKLTMPKIIGGVVLSGVLLMAIFFFMIKPGLQATGLEEKDDGTTTLVLDPVPMARYTAEFDFKSIDPSAQNDDTDVDLDIFEWDPDANADLVRKGYIDCSGVTPANFDGINVDIELADENFCKINYYKYWQDSGFTGGDSELKLDDYLRILVADDKVKVDSGSETLTAGKTYLVTAKEIATSSNQDLVPFAFLLTSAKETTLNVEDILDGTVKIDFIYRYYSDAGTEGKYKIGGECEDSEDGSTTLDSTLEGALDTSITANTTGVDITCELSVEITADGYALIMNNPLADSNSEKSYISGQVWGQSWTNASYGVWQVMAEDATYKVKYAAGDPAAVGYYTMWEETVLDGITITDDSTTNCDVNNQAKLRDTPGLSKNIYDDGAEIFFPVKFLKIQKVWSAGTSATGSASLGDGDETLADSDDMLDLDIYTVEGGTNLFDHDVEA